MCGVAGLITGSPDAGWNGERRESVLAGMSARLAHRGPDDRGHWAPADVGVGLAHSRLAIVDLSSGGHQPMHSQNGRWVMVYNGEVYNYSDLRTRLLRNGVALRSDSDSEVLLELLSTEGVRKGLEDVEGMFAFALWDRQERTLTLARDRMGEKPLYYGWISGDFVFASELKALSAHGSFPPDHDSYALQQFLRYGYIPTPYSAYEGIYKLPAGHTLTVRGDRRGESADVPSPYWCLSEICGRAAGLKEPEDPWDAVDEFEALALEAVWRRMTTADVPVGAFLSGGVDSSLVVALMQSMSSTPVKTFTIGFGETGYDESPKARAVARQLGTEHSSPFVGPDEARSIIPELPRIYDEPFADSSQIPTCLLAAVTKRSVDVALTGDGADELLGGYDRYTRLLQVASLKHLAGGAAARALGWGLESIPSAVGDAISWLSRQREEGSRRAFLGERTQKLGQMLRADTDAEMYRELVSSWSGKGGAGRTEGSRRSAESTWDRAWPELDSTLEMACFADQATYLCDDILVKVDRATMSVGLEARAPYLDHHLVEWSWAIPAGLKRRSGVGKWILRQSLSRYLSQEVVEQPDHGFGAPVGDWLEGPLRGWGEELLSGDEELCAGLLDRGVVRERWREQVSGRRDWHQHLWHVVMLEAWLREGVESAR